MVYMVAITVHLPATSGGVRTPSLRRDASARHSVLAAPAVIAVFPVVKLDERDIRPGEVAQRQKVGTVEQYFAVAIRQVGLPFRIVAGAPCRASARRAPCL